MTGDETDTIDATIPPTGGTAGPSPTECRRRRRVPIALLAAVLVAAGLLGWRSYVGVQAEAVTVAWDGRMSCTGTEVSYRSIGPGREGLRPVPMRGGLDCTLPVSVTNDSSWGVRVDRVVLSGMGPGGGAAIKAAPLDGVRPRRGEVDAVYPLDRALAPGEAYSFDVRLLFRERGCSSEDSTLTVSGFPTVHVSLLGGTAERDAPERLPLAGTADSSCDS
jgi:hypothetical protein